MLATDFFHVDCAVTLQRLYCMFVIEVGSLRAHPRCHREPGRAVDRAADPQPADGARFDSGPITYGPYFFPDLAGISETEEQAPIDARLIEAGRIQYAGRQRPDRCGPPAPA